MTKKNEDDGRDVGSARPPSQKVARDATNPSAAVAATEGALVQREDGATIIHHEVVAKVAGMAVKEVNGVRELVPFDASQSVTQLASRVFGTTMRELGISVEVGKTQAAVDVRIIADYGSDLVEVCDAVRANVRRQVEHMTGLECVEVNIEVIDLWFPDDHTVPRPTLFEPEPRRQLQ